MSGELATLIARLEAATTKLEALSTGGAATATGAAGGLNRGPAPPAGASGGDVPASVTAFDDIIHEGVDPFVALSNKIGGEVSAHAELLKKAFEAQRDFILMASKSKKPSDSDLPKFLTPLGTAIGNVCGFRDLPENRRTKMNNQLATVSEGSQALQWVLQAPKPGPFVKDMSEAAEFYGNRVIKDFKDKEEAQVEWARAHKNIYTKLQEYIKQYHTTGLVWNAQGGNAYVPEKGASAGSAPAAAGRAAPPPPPGAPGAPAPPPPPPKMNAEELNRISSAGADAQRKPAGGAAALFAEINKGSAVTAGLRKVDKSEMTHKNPSLRASSVVKAEEKPKSAAPVAAGAGARGPAKKGPPKMDLQGKKWIIENYDNNRDLEINDCEMNQSLYIYKCDHCLIKVNKKINAITLDGCKKTALVFDSAVASLEVVGCQSVQVQVMKNVPIVNVDKTDGFQIFLPREAVGVTEFITAKSSEMNIVIPGPTDEDDIVETAVCEQFKTVYKNGKWITEPLESMG